MLPEKYKEGGSQELVKDQPKNPEREWEKYFNKEENSEIERNLKLLQYFGDKLKTAQERSGQLSKEGIIKLDRRAEELGVADPEEINVIKQELNNFENQKQEIIKSGENQIKNVVAEKANVEDVNYEEVGKNDELKTSKQPDETEKIKPEDEIEKSAEQTEEKPLEPGDEVYKDGVIYKIHDFTPEYDEKPTAEGHSYTHFDEKEHRYVTSEEKKVGDVADAERKEKEKPHRHFRAVITGPGGGGLSYFTEDQVTRVTPELRKKIEKMKKESGRGKDFGTNGDYSNI